MITKDQAEKLHKAIDLAVNNGHCKYVTAQLEEPKPGQVEPAETFEPCCIIGQYLCLEGISTIEMRAWDALPQSYIGGKQLSHDWHGSSSPIQPSILKLHKIAPGSVRTVLLSDLQCEWDAQQSGNALHDEEALKKTRARMHARVNEELVDG